MEKSLNEKELAEFQEIFSLVAGERDYITMAQLQQLLSTLQVRVDQRDLEDMFFDETIISRGGASTAIPSSGFSFNSINTSSDSHAGNRIYFHTFLEVMKKRLHAEFSKEELLKAFETFDDLPGGYISTDSLVHALTTYGTEKLSQEEATKIVAAIDPQNTGRFKYTEFVEKVMDQY